MTINFDCLCIRVNYSSQKYISALLVLMTSSFFTSQHYMSLFTLLPMHKSVPISVIVACNMLYCNWMKVDFITYSDFISGWMNVIQHIIHLALSSLHSSEVGHRHNSDCDALLCLSAVKLTECVFVSHCRCPDGPRPSTMRPCQLPCKKDCIVTPFSDWTPCPVTCDTGTMVTVSTYSTVFSLSVWHHSYESELWTVSVAGNKQYFYDSLPRNTTQTEQGTLTAT